MESYGAYYSILAPLLHQTGEKLRQHFGKVETFDQKTNSPADAVTELDRWAESFLAERLKEHDKSITFYGEEHGGNNGAERFWLVDPIDGTAHFIRGIPFCTTMIALIEQGEVVFSAIYDFIRSDIYWAAKGEGAKCNDEPIHVSTRSLKEAYLCYEIDLNQPKNLEAWLTLKKQTLFVKTISSGYEFALVASGRLDGRICIKPFGKDWDYAPGSLLVAEAGGTVRNIGKETYDYRDHNFIAANEKVYREVLPFLSS